MKTKLIAGNNRLRVCPETMITVAQAWLDEELASPVDVLEVSYDSGASVFEIRFKRTEETPA